MKSNIEFKLKPFSVPNYVITERDPTIDLDETPIPLQALSSEVLDRLCNDFRDAVFKKARKPQPPIQG